MRRFGQAFAAAAWRSRCVAQASPGQRVAAGSAVPKGGQSKHGLAELLGFTGNQRGVFVPMAMMPFSVATYLLVGTHYREVHRPPAPVTQRSHVPL